MPFLLIGYSLNVIETDRYVEKRRAVAQMVPKIKNDWFQQKAKDVELRVLHGESGGVWRCICDIQRGRGGLVPNKP